MKKPILTKTLFLNLTLIFLLTGLYSCGGGDESTGDDSEDIEITIDAMDENEGTVESDADVNTDGSATKSNVDVDEREDMSVSSEPVNVDLELEFESPKYEGTYKFSEVDEPPMFEECAEMGTTEEQEACFQKFLIKNISKNIKYPEKAKALNVEGKTYIAFVVSKEGLISQSKVVRGSGYNYERTDKPINEYIDAYKELDAAAIKAIKETPKIKPAMLANAPVDVQYIIPVVFDIE